MNMPRDKFHQENPAQPVKSVDEQKIREMEEELELLREQVDSLKQVLSHENQVANYYFQELEETKRELDVMNEELNALAAADYQSVNEIKEPAKNNPRNNTFHSESLDNSTSESAGSYPVEVNESESIDGSTAGRTLDRIIIQSREIRIDLRKIASNSSQIKTRSDTIVARSEKLVGRAKEITVRSRQVRQELRLLKGDDNNLQKPALHPKGAARDAS
ncbi:MAG TPA: hypothetical protein V6C85_08710 [Allocoleopsis sp.]